MDSPSTSSRSSKITALHRGEACLTCRRRKMKCDAGKPACAPCLRAGKGDDCEYEETKWLGIVQKLEDQVRSLRERIAEYEGGAGSLASPLVASPLSAPPFHAYVDTPSPSDPYPSFAHPTRSPAQLAASMDVASRGNSPRGASDSSGSQVSQTSPFGTAILPYSGSPPTTGTPLSASPGGHILPYELPSGTYDAPITSPQDVPWVRAPRSHHSSPADLASHAELPHNTVLRLVDIFMPHASQCGLEIVPSTFMASLSQPPANQPHPALMNAIYMWACHYSQSASYVQHEPLFLHRTLVELARGMEARDRLVNLVQAQCLVALYLFIKGRLLEGYHHTGGAVRLAVTLGLHQIAPGAWRGAPLQLDTAHANAFLPPPASALEEDERILAWWQAFALDRCWATVLELPLAHPDSDHPRALITTPFARAPAPGTPDVNVAFSFWSACVRAKDVALKSESPFPFLLQGSAAHQPPHAHHHPGLPSPVSPVSAAPFAGPASNSLQHLLIAPEYSFVERLDTLDSLRAKAAALFQRASALAATYHPHRQPSPAFWVDFHSVSNAVERLTSLLPPLFDGFAGPVPDRHARFTVHALTHAAAIRLYGIFAAYEHSAWREKCIGSAHAAADALSTLGDADYNQLDPFVGICWVHIGAFLHNDLYAHGRGHTSSHDTTGSPRQAQLRDIIADLDAVTLAAKRLSVVFPFLDIHVQQLEQGRTPT